MSSEPLDDAALRRAADRARMRPGRLMAGLAWAYDQAFPDERLPSLLCCSERAAAELELCLRPRPDRWDADVREIASASGIDPDRLEVFLSKALVAERLALAHPPLADETASALLAARDREED